MGPAAPAYRRDIDGLRAVAVVAVIAFHADDRLAPGGFAGVDIFFVISGFLISGIIVKGLEQDAFAFVEFYARRARRIFPALIVVLAAVWAIGWFLLLPDAYAQLGGNIAAGAGFVSNLALWKQSGYFDVAADQKPLLHLWSLGVEEQFYLVWPALMAACWTWRANLLGVILVVAAASFAVNVLAVHAHPAAVFYLPVTRLWELSLGGLLACASVATLQRDAGVLSTVLRRYCTRPQRVREIETAFGALLIAVAFVELNRLRAFPGVWALLPAVGTFLVISAGPDAWINRRLLSGRAVVFVGLISFPLYLWHWPLLSYARIRSIGPPPVAWKTGAVIAAFLLASLTYWLIELPIRSTSGARLPRLAVALSLALGVVAAGGVWTDAGGGAPGRFAKVLQQVTNYKYDYAAEYREGRCFLMPGQSETAFGADCADPVSAKPMVFLWGDSHGAHLYPGLRRLQRERTFGVAQFTASGCPPLLGAAQTNRPLCAEINQSVFARIRSMKPAVVLLSAWWLSYPDVTALAATVAALKQAGVGRIVLVGPVPNWDHTLPEVLVAAFTRDPRHRVPTRTSLGLMPSLAPLDRSLRATAGRLGITYVSALDVFCNVDGCLVRTGDQASDLVAWDASHLTAVGSQLLVSAVVSAFADVLPGPRSQG